MEVQIHKVDTHLSIKAVGEYSLANLYDLFDKAKEETEKRGAQGVILDITEVAGTIPAMHMYLLGVQCCRVLSSENRIALLCPDGEADKFLENVPQSRGLHIKVVQNHSDALKWVNSHR